VHDGDVAGLDVLDVVVAGAPDAPLDDLERAWSDLAVAKTKPSSS
jgi:hypothetical protein